MKFKHIIGIALFIFMGGCIAFELLKKKEVKTSESNRENPVKSKSDEKVVLREQKSNDTMRQVYKSMDERNEKAKEVLTDIHNEMKKSEEKINEKKNEIESLMGNFKK